MSSKDRLVVHATIERHCTIRRWTLHKLNVRSNHVHIVVTAPDCAPAIVRDQLKAWCTRKLKAIHPRRSHFWTEGASCRWINHEDDLESAIRYVGEAQNRKWRDR
ncbi:transposase [Maioricimonas rarisocia]|uniref:transposase n=1 Tax=Maioricimonas rarisocia TaxID=2528026 RepID=UPI0036F34E63